MDNERQVIGIISIIAYNTGDIELKFAGIEKRELHKVFAQFEKLAREYADKN